MPHTRYAVGSSFAMALSKAAELSRDPDAPRFRTVDLINIGRHSANMAHDILNDDPDAARDCLIHAASRLLAAAERIEGIAAQPIVTALPMPTRRHLRIVP